MGCASLRQEFGVRIEGSAGWVQGFERSCGVRLAGSSSTCEFAPIRGQLIRVGRLLSSWNAGFAVQIRKLWSGREPGLAMLLSPRRMRDLAGTWARATQCPISSSSTGLRWCCGGRGRSKVSTRATQRAHKGVPRRRSGWHGRLVDLAACRCDLSSLPGCGALWERPINAPLLPARTSGAAWLPLAFSWSIPSPKAFMR